MLSHGSPSIVNICVPTVEFNSTFISLITGFIGSLFLDTFGSICIDATVVFLLTISMRTAEFILRVASALAVDTALGLAFTASRTTPTIIQQLLGKSLDTPTVALSFLPIELGSGSISRVSKVLIGFIDPGEVVSLEVEIADDLTLDVFLQ